MNRITLNPRLVLLEDWHTIYAALERVRAVVRERVPTLQDDRHVHPDLLAAIDLVNRGALITAAGEELLPRLSAAPPLPAFERGSHDAH